MFNSIFAPLLAGGITQLITWLGSIGGMGIAMPLIVEFLKKSPAAPWVTESTSKAALRVVAVVTAAVSSAGISYAYDDTVGTFLVSGVTALGLAHFLLDVAMQFGVQELAYKFLIKARR